jgi:predicted small metal-binding protein
MTRGANDMSERENDISEREGKHIACNAVVPGCSFTASAATEDELMQKVAEHAAAAHGVTEVSPELAAQVRAAIESR